MSRARAIEFNIRLTAEVLSQQGFSKAKTYEELLKSERRPPKTKVDKHIRQIFGGQSDRIILIRQCADAMAHADYSKGRQKINEYKNKYELKSEVSDDVAKLTKIENVLDEDGKQKDIKYELVSSDDNLILEEFSVFGKQGYIDAISEILGIAEKSLNVLVSDLSLKYGVLMLQRAIRYGDRHDLT